MSGCILRSQNSSDNGWLGPGTPKLKSGRSLASILGLRWTLGHRDRGYLTSRALLAQPRFIHTGPIQPAKIPIMMTILPGVLEWSSSVLTFVSEKHHCRSSLSLWALIMISNVSQTPNLNYSVITIFTSVIIKNYSSIIRDGNGIEFSAENETHNWSD